MNIRVLLIVLISASFQICFATSDVQRLTLSVHDADTNAKIPCRVYIQGEDGKWYFPKSDSPQGTAIRYEKQNWINPRSIEMHTTVSAHPFYADLPQGQYSITIERGKEYIPLHKQIEIKGKPVSLSLKLKRWINMASLGWYSGDTHVHRSIMDLKNIMPAEDLNITFPLLQWVASAYTSPAKSSHSVPMKTQPPIIYIDHQHAICTRNTEYELNRVKGRQHTLGAFFALNHQHPLTEGAPPVAPVAQTVHQNGGLIELDKHNWPWSMMLIPIMNVDLFELANNHMWRTEFAFNNFGEPDAPYMNIEKDDQGWTEWGWIEYGFKNYYALLSCGFRLRPTAGTANGVHPVPLGFGRVYVHLQNGFDVNKWINGLNLGRSFVTTGPMLSARVNNQWPATTFHHTNSGPNTYKISATIHSQNPIEKIELIKNGEVYNIYHPQTIKTSTGAFKYELETIKTFNSTTWIALRCFEDRKDGRIRFAHTAPFFFNFDSRPLHPKPEEINDLINRMKKELKRNQHILSNEAIKEYQKARSIYQEIAKP